MKKDRLDETVEMNISSDTKLLHVMRVVTRSLADSMGFIDTEAENAGLAVEEALTNVIEHAYHGENGHRIQVIYEMKGARFQIRIVHNGDQVDQRDLAGAEDLSNYYRQKKKGGLGILLIKKCMDEVTYKSSRRKNECCMVKYLR